MPIKLLIVDDHEIVRHGLAAVFKDSPVRIIGTAESGDEAIKLTRKLKPDVVLLDVRLADKDGIEAIRKIRSSAPGVKVVMLSAFDNPTYVARSLSAGAHDYILKTASRADLIQAVSGAAAGSVPSRAGEMRRMVTAMAERAAPTDAQLPLTPRETQVLRHVAMGLANKEIADALQISVETVKEHVQNLLRKISLHDRTQAAVWAIRHGIA
jgi:DNA-binding NarL/FixJ family response regulator